MHTRLFSIGNSEYDATKVEFTGDHVRATNCLRKSFDAWIHGLESEIFHSREAK
jgi:hypothetical protein